MTTPGPFPETCLGQLCGATLRVRRRGRLTSRPRRLSLFWLALLRNSSSLPCFKALQVGLNPEKHGVQGSFRMNLQASGSRFLTFLASNGFHHGLNPWIFPRLIVRHVRQAAELDGDPPREVLKVAFCQVHAEH
jgi:hypothetical protein